MEDGLLLPVSEKERRQASVVDDGMSESDV